ncbi:MAG TPA: NrsF family protein, partial [Bryobacteraceae bacterium]|nr:NrsF family protein [Bryobacteraceae bacterium]
GVAAGAFAGLAGIGMLELHCPNLAAMHVMVWHVAVLVVSGILGGLAGWLIRRFDNRPPQPHR